MRKWILMVLLLVPVTAVLAESAGRPVQQAHSKPNFIFFITDDISPNDIGAYGNQVVRTPNLDRIARQGLVFDNAYNVISSCSASRCSIVSGRYPHNSGAPELMNKLPEDQRTFVQELRKGGYYTVISGKNHMGKADVLGFDVSSDSKPAGSENWVKHLRERPKDKPFFCWFASHDAHHPFEINEKAPQYDPAEVPVPPMLFDGPETRKELAQYYHEVSRTDYYAGEIMKELEAQGVADNTYFIYCSDNGRPLPRCKTYLYESGSQTPLIISGPGVTAGRTQSLVSSIDYSATILELAELRQPETVQGVSFAPILGNPQAEVRTVAFSERNWHVYPLHERAVRMGDWLYIWNAWPNKHNVCGESSVFEQFPAAKELWEAADQGKLTEAQKLLTLPEQPPEMLFNVKRDPYQFTNLVNNPEQAKVLEQMRGLLDQWKEQTGDSVPENPTPARQPLHTRARWDVSGGEFPGAANEATKINHPGPGIVPAEKEVSVVERPAEGLRNAHYTSNRAPLLPSPFAKLPIGAIRPDGWLRKQLENQASGMCGHLNEISSFCMKEGNAWLDKNGKGHGWWEEVPYWLKGFGDLGYVLDDKRIEEETQEWIEAMLASQRADGWFGPVNNLRSTRNKSSIEGEQVRGRPDMWPNALMLTVLRSNFEHTGDERIIKHMLNYCDWLIALPEKDYLIHWVGKRRGVELLKNILWLYNVTGEKKLLELAHKTHRRTNDWTSEVSRYHNVDFAECFYEPGLYYTLSLDRKHYDAVERNRNHVYDEFGQVPGGMYGGDERMRPGYVGPRQAVETCGMVEMMHSCELMLSQVDGEIKWADRCENVAFNSYPAALTAEMDGIRYLVAPNMPVGDRVSKNPDIDNSGAMYIFNPHAHRCCQHNHAHGWPYFAEYLWLATADNGLCAMFYSESSVEAVVADGQKVSVKQETSYPFSDAISFTFEDSATFPFYLRIPGWCSNPSVKVNGKALDTEGATGQYVRIHRAWKSGDKVELILPMEVVVRTWAQNNDCVSVDRGPLTYSLKIQERVELSDGRDTVRQKKFLSDDANFKDWPAYETFPTTPWNFGLLPEEGFDVIERAWPDNDMPWTHEGSPVSLKAKAKIIPGWKLQANNMVGAMQQSPIKSDEPVETVELLPMGACRIRISAFPTIGNGADAKEWKPQEESRVFKTADGTRMVASFWNTEDYEKPDCLFDGLLPESSDAKSERVTFRPRKGAFEKVELEFAAERMVNGIEVYWANDGAKGGCRLPAKAELFYFSDDTWMPAFPETSVPVAKDKLNRLEIDPVSTTAIQLRIHQQEGYSVGMMELRIF